MAEACDSTTVGPEKMGNKSENFRSRGYQLEMLEASLQQNIIVAVSQMCLFAAKKVALYYHLMLKYRWTRVAERLTCML